MQIEGKLALIGVASGIGAADTDCAQGPEALQRAHLEAELAAIGVSACWQTLLAPTGVGNKLQQISEICQRLACCTAELVQQQKLFAVVGGDHSCAVGTWSGVRAAMGADQQLGLVWIDAHLDSHTPQTSTSGNIHGMPLAALLGHGAQELTALQGISPKLYPEHVSIIGARSMDPGERDLIQQLGVRVYAMPEIEQRGVRAVLQEAIDRASQGTSGFGISLDLDALDPQDAPGVGTPESNGIRLQDLQQAFAALTPVATKLLGLEIVEFNPVRDRQGQTIQCIKHLLQALVTAAYSITECSDNVKLQHYS